MEEYPGQILKYDTNILQRRYTESDINVINMHRESGELLVNKDDIALAIPLDDIYKEYQSHDDVRIYPGTIVMANAFDMKEFKEKFVIRNCGKRRAIIKIFSPNSSNFKLQTIPNGVDLPPGLEIVRYVTHKFRQQTSLSQVAFPIFINGSLINYSIVVTVPHAIVNVSENKLEFDPMDIGETMRQSITLTNSGHKSGFFSMDVVPTEEVQINIRPRKGIVEAMKQVTVDIEITGLKPGKHAKEFWIKTDPLQRVRIFVEIIVPELIPTHPFTDFDITVIDFPKVYYGSSCMKTLVFKNISALPSMFCTLAEIEQQFVEISQAAEIDENYKFFTIISKDGRLAPHSSTIILIKFAPYKKHNFKRKFAMGLIRIIRVLFRDFSANDDRIFYNENDNISSNVMVPRDLIEDENDNDISEAIVPNQNRHEEKFIRVCFQGEIEQAKMTIRPESVGIVGDIGSSYDHELFIKNESTSLPIIYSYVKVPYADVYPKVSRLGPGESREILMTMKPQNIGQSRYKIVFKLLYPKDDDSTQMDEVGESYIDICVTGIYVSKEKKNKYVMGITPFVTNEVGYLEKEVTFDRKNELPKSAIIKETLLFEKKVKGSDLVALPNDRQRSLRPWRNSTKCATLFTNLPRTISPNDDYNLNSAEIDSRAYNKTYYIDFIRSFRKPVFKEIISNDYDLTNKKHLLMQNMKCLLSCKEKQREMGISAFIPLTPGKLNNIIITPREISLGKVACFSTETSFFQIENNNNFKIYVQANPCKSCITIAEKYMRIGSYSTKICEFSLRSTAIEHITATIAILINSSHIFEITVLAQIIAPGLTCDVHDVVMQPNQNIFFLKVKNPVDVSVPFNWNVSDTRNFNIYPRVGSVPPKKDMIFVLKYQPKVDAVNNIEVNLVSHNDEQNVLVKHEARPVVYEFNIEHVEFGKMPVNVLKTKELYLRNLSDNSITFIVENSAQIYGTQIKPIKGIIKPNSMKLFYINAKFREIFDFSTSFVFTFDQSVQHSIQVSGHIQYPKIKLTPAKIQVKKIVPQAMSRYDISVTNESETDANVKFLMEHISEFSVKDSQDKTVREIKLTPKERRRLFLEFAPTEAVAYGVYLPIEINNIFGPPKFNVETSISPKSYLSNKDLTVGMTPVPVPAKLPLMVLTCAAGSHLLKFSSLKFKFNTNTGYVKQEWTMENVTKMKIRMIIDLTELAEPFEINYWDGPRPAHFERTQLIRFKPGDISVMNIQFHPQDYGNYLIKLPIYIKEYYNNCVFNYLELSGVFDPPTIIPEVPILYFDIVLPNEVSERSIFLTLMNHVCWCTISCECKIPQLRIKVGDMNSRSMSTISVTISFEPIDVCLIDDNITFICTCGAVQNLIVRGVADFCTATAYFSYFKGYSCPSNVHLAIDDATSDEIVGVHECTVLCKYTDFPYFPMLDTNKLFSHLNKSLTIVESWLYTQGFFGKDYYKLPFNISKFSPFTEEQSKSKSKPKNGSQKILPIHQLIINICDNTVTKYISSDIELKEGDPISETLYCYSMYNNLITFLKGCGMLATHIHPEILIAHDQYLIFKEHIYDNYADNVDTELLELDVFYSLSTQAWLDLILQIFKIFVLSRVTLTIREKQIRSHLDAKFYDYYDEHVALMDDYDANEAALLLWLEYIFHEHQGLILDLRVERSVRSFVKDLQDGIILAVLIVAYCPYMISTISNIITTDKRDESRIHNACILIQVFQTLKFSIDVDPIAIAYPDAIEMVMLVTYLYEVLPSLYPDETIELETVLAGIKYREVTLKNASEFPICYRSILLPVTNFFSVQPETIVVPPKNKKVVKIFYHAKSVYEHKTTVILSGETPKYKYAKSIAFSVSGKPTYATEEVTKLKCNIYKPTTKNLNIKSPYTDYSCNIYSCLKTPPLARDDFISWKQWDSEKVPRQISSNSTECHFNAEGMARLKINVCYIVPGKKNIILFFLHEKGDFCINLKINVIYKKNSRDQLYVDIPFNFFNSTCVCGGKDIKQSCPKNLKINVPYKNRMLWEGLMILIKTSRPTEEAFWKKYLDKPVGIYILKMVMSSCKFWEYEEFDQIFGENIEYSIKPSKKLKAQSKIVIPDVNADNEFVTVIVHSKQNPVKESLKLTAKHDKETRDYVLYFFDNRHRSSIPAQQDPDEANETDDPDSPDE